MYWGEVPDAFCTCATLVRGECAFSCLSLLAGACSPVDSLHTPSRRSRFAVLHQQPPPPDGGASATSEAAETCALGLQTVSSTWLEAFRIKKLLLTLTALPSGVKFRLDSKGVCFYWGQAEFWRGHHKVGSWPCVKVLWSQVSVPPGSQYCSLHPLRDRVCVAPPHHLSSSACALYSTFTPILPVLLCAVLFPPAAALMGKGSDLVCASSSVAVPICLLLLPPHLISAPSKCSFCLFSFSLGLGNGQRRGPWRRIE